MSNFIVKKVAVLGAGVMGAKIAAHCLNAKIPVVLFDLPAKEGPKNGIVMCAIENLKKLSPAPLGNKGDAALIEVANYEEKLDVLAGCDLIIEAISERMDWKHDLYKKEGGAAHCAECDFRFQYVRPVDHRAVGGLRRLTESTLLRRSLLQTAALHASSGTDRDRRHQARDP